MLRILFLVSLLALCGCTEHKKIPVSISGEWSDSGVLLINYRISGGRDICVSKSSLTADPLATFPGQKVHRKVIIKNIERSLLNKQIFPHKNNGEIEVWRNNGQTVAPGVSKEDRFEILIQAFYCDQIFNSDKNIDSFEYFYKNG